MFVIVNLNWILASKRSYRIREVWCTLLEVTGVSTIRPVDLQQRYDLSEWKEVYTDTEKHRNICSNPVFQVCELMGPSSEHDLCRRVGIYGNAKAQSLWPYLVIF